MDLRKKTYSALFWSLCDRGGEQVIRFVLSIVLARLLLPEHFGLIGMAYVVIELARVFVLSGFGLALINNQEATITDECSVFYFNIIIGFIGTALIFASSPFIGYFYKSPELIPILKVLSFNVVLGSFGTIQNVMMTKRIDFKAQTLVSLPATMLSGGVGIAMAYAGYGVWALVVQTFFRTALQTILLWFVHSWRPRLLFSLTSLKKMFGFGSKMLLVSLVQMIFGNIYTIFIGKVFSPSQLGFYTRANQTQQLPLDTIWTIVGRVAFPVFSSIKNDSDKMRRALEKASGNLSFLVFPSLIISAVAAPVLFKLFFGERWLPSVPMFQILCISNLFYPLENLLNNAILSKGNTSLNFKLQIFKYATILCSIIFSIPFGINGMLIAYGALSYLTFLLSAFFTEREIGYKMSSQITDLLPYLICSCFAGTAMFLVSLINIENDILLMLCQISTGTVIYAGLSFFMKLKALQDTIDILSPFLLKMLLRKKISNGTNNLG
ncbi:MAG: lipopolysaccharide biosynthesis protein [Fibrobacter sp.]|nr:lipopolysaccharide biosynthesis protein [Fibrobacter sp.]